MAIGSGYFLKFTGANSPEVISIIEHQSDVERRPEKYGLTSKEIESLKDGVDDLEEKRKAVLIATMKNGFIRVRDHGPNHGTTFEFYKRGDLKKVFETIDFFLESKKYRDTDYVRFSNIATGKSKAWTVKDYRAAVKSDELGKIFDFSSKKEKDKDSKKRDATEKVDKEAHTKSPVAKGSSGKKDAPSARMLDRLAKQDGMTMAQARRAYYGNIGDSVSDSDIANQNATVQIMESIRSVSPFSVGSEQCDRVRDSVSRILIETEDSDLAARNIVECVSGFGLHIDEFVSDLAFIIDEHFG